ncbi:MAG: peptide ABC transporter permease [Candidatus Hecatellales archaeon]|nr:MAG: peptide ABC transporter permease [Candidatus Hecatellales archaeon]
MGFLAYLARRAGSALLSFFIITIIAFILCRVVPGDPALLMVGSAVNPEEWFKEYQKMRALLGLDRPIYEQYLIWLRDIFTGNFGVSYRFNVPVGPLILERLPATLELVIPTVVLALLIGVLLSTPKFFRRMAWADKLASGFSFLGMSISYFIWGIFFIIIFGVSLNVLPISGRLDMGIELPRITGFIIIDSLLSGRFEAIGSFLKHLIMPVAALTLYEITLIHRINRSSMLSVMKEDYILMDKAKGLSQFHIVFVRGLRNALIPTLTLLGVQFTVLLSGSVIIEKMFAWPGIGKLLVSAVTYRDLPLIQGIIATYCIIVIITNFIIDSLYGKINPRIKYV